MRVSVNVDFTDDELKKFVADAGVKMVSGVVRETARDLRDPYFKAMVSQFTQMILQAISGSAPWSGPASERGPFVADFGDHCTSLGADAGFDWTCCRCGALNGIQMEQCGRCKHERCGGEKPPEPPPSKEDMA